MENRTKFFIILILAIILIILLVHAYNKPTKEIEVQLPVPKYVRKGPKNSRGLLEFGKSKTAGKSTNKREEKCRQIFESIYKAKFPTKRPSFLKNPKTGKNLELDGFNEQLKIAFEYNGEQHYNFPNTFHKTEEEFKRQVKRDDFKRQKCLEQGIDLVEIPYTVEDDQLFDFIKSRCRPR